VDRAIDALLGFKEEAEAEAKDRRIVELLRERSPALFQELLTAAGQQM